MTIVRLNIIANITKLYHSFESLNLPVVNLLLGVSTTIFIQSCSPNGIPQQPEQLSFSPAFAQTQQKPIPKLQYVPPSRRSPKSTVATGSRPSIKCSQSEQSSPRKLTLLVPQDHDGLTASSHPTFFWHISAPVAITLTLTEPGVPQPLLKQQIQPQAAGIGQFQLPQNLPELALEREYRWSLTLNCNPNRPSANPYIQSWIKRVPISASLTQQLVNTNSESDRARIYARAGLWYDALAAISSAQSANPGDLSIVDERLSLMKQVGIELR